MTECQAEKYLLSAQEDELTSALTLSGIQPGHVVMINRNFVRLQDHLAPNYFNMNDGVIDKHSQAKIHQLKELVESIIPGANVIRHSVKWKSLDNDLGETFEDREYLKRFTTEVEAAVLKVIGDHVDTEDRSPYNNYTGINRRLCEELMHQSRLCQTFSNEVNSSVIAKLRTYLQNSAQNPMVLHGPPGSGRSSVIAKMAAECPRLLPEAAALVRFCGMTPFSCSMFSVFHSIIQQIDCLNESSFNPGKDEMPHRSFPVYSERACFQTLLDLATELQPLVILMDDVTADSGSWLPRQLPPHVKMIVTLQDQQTVERLKKDFRQDNCFIELPELSGENSKYLNALTKHLLSECTLKSNAPFEVSGGTEKKTTPNESVNIKTISDEYFSVIERQFGRDLVVRILRLLLSAKVGLMSSALIDLLLDDDDANSVPTRHLVTTTWQCVRCCLLPFLHSCHHGDSILHMWMSASLKVLARERYLSSADDVKSIHKQICYYLVKRWNESHGTSGTSDSKSVIKPSENNLVHELPYHSILSGSKDRKLLDSFIYNPVWLADSIDFTSTVHVCQVLRFVQTEPDGDDSIDLETMLQVIWLSHQALDVSGRQIYSQMITRLRSVMHDAKRLPKISKLFNVCRSSKVSYVVPSKMCLARDIKEADRLAECHGEAPCSLYVIGPNSGRVANLFDEKGEIVIWDLSSGEQVKTLRNLNHPRALAMIDDSRAVILCDRELKVYDLDREQVVRNLRGVLNLKMPLFSVPNQENVVALSRNRMYVNVLDIATGDMVATFKAGEDRFLDSLLVSKNGNVLVCGDATQKPSPLLVWNLKESRLVHDLRMAQHEYITSIADVTNDGHYVVCACVELDTENPNFVAVYDLASGQLFKVLKTTRNTTCLSTDVHLNCVVSGLETGDFLVWDLVSGHTKFYIHGVGSWFNCMAMASQSPICMSYYTGVKKNPEARTVCLWDYKKGCLLTSFTFDSPLTCAVLSPDGHKVVVGLHGYEDIIVLRLTPMVYQEGSNSRNDES
ncbi:uncharacterized protein LOC121388670 isoform X2 [Gigantopelta aegis]|nr:uncharacterized protein LOC121388670 isoform X2 [Gigantopelta aegis]